MRKYIAIIAFVLLLVGSVCGQMVPPPPGSTSLNSIPKWVDWAKQLRAQGNAQEKKLTADPRQEVWVCQVLPSRQVQNNLSIWGAKTSYIISLRGDNGLLVPDPTDPNRQKLLYDANGLEVLTDEATFKAALRSMIPAEYVGPAAFDQEGKLELHATADPTTDPLAAQAIKTMQTMLRWANDERPKAIWGFYGIPSRVTWGTQSAMDPDEVIKLDQQSIMRADAIGVSAYFPSLYNSVYGETWTSAWRDKINRICLQQCLVSAKPTYPFVWKRYHNNGNLLSGLGDTLIDPDEYASDMYGIKDVSVNGVRCRGAMVWGDDYYYIAALGEDAYPNAWPPADRLDIMRERSVLMHERIPGMSTYTYIDSTDTYYIQLTCHVLRDYPILGLPVANLGPIDTQTKPPAPGPAPIATNVQPNGQGIWTLKTGGPYTISGETLASDRGVVIENDQRVTDLRITNTSITTPNYAIYSGGCDSATLSGCHLKTTTGGDNYCIRGSFMRFDAKDTTLDNTQVSNKCALRIYGLYNGTWSGGSIRGGPLWLGGGTSDSNVNPAPFENFLFSDCTIELTNTVHIDALQFFDKTDHVMFQNVKFVVRQGARLATFWNGAHDIYFKHCTFNGGPVSFDQFKDGQNLKLTAGARNIQISD